MYHQLQRSAVVAEYGLQIQYDNIQKIAAHPFSDHSSVRRVIRIAASNTVTTKFAETFRAKD